MCGCATAVHSLQCCSRMFAFVVYALAVWYAAFRWRREWRSLTSVGVGLGGIALVAWLHWVLGVWSEGRIQVAVFQSMLYPYAGLVAMVGVYLSRLPRILTPSLRCLRCNYDMRGLEQEPEAVCPECGRRLNPPRHAAIRVNPVPRAKPRQREGPAPEVLRWPRCEAGSGVPATDH